MSSENYWRMCDTLSVFQAIMLILGYNPENIRIRDIEGNVNEPPPEGYVSLQTAISKALEKGQIEGNLQFYNYGNDNIVNLDESDISVSSLKKYLKSKNMTDNFFFSPNEAAEEYLDPENPYYVPKMAAILK